MELYPLDYIEHNIPLVVLSGLGGTGWRSDDQLPELYGGHGTTVSSELPLVESENASQLREALLQADRTQRVWKSDAKRNGDGLIGFRFKAIGRASLLA